MGMFDDVRCEVPLPDGYEGEFQTQDFDCELTLYKITPEGRLLRQEYEYVDSPSSPLGIRREQRDWTDVEFHGRFRFYGSDREGVAPLAPYDPSRWHEYEAKFTDGQLVEIVMFPQEAATANPDGESGTANLTEGLGAPSGSNAPTDSLGDYA